MSARVEDRQIDHIAAEVTTPRLDGCSTEVVITAPREQSPAFEGATSAPAWLNAEGIDVLDVEVTESDIDHSRRCLPTLCMVAVATRRQLGLLERRHFAWTRAWDARRVDNRLWVGCLSNDDRWRINYQGVDYLLPRDVAERIVAWDVGSPVEPFRFRALRLSRRGGSERALS
jgi:hypothetical protein